MQEWRRSLLHEVGLDGRGPRTSVLPSPVEVDDAIARLGDLQVREAIRLSSLDPREEAMLVRAVDGEDLGRSHNAVARGRADAAERPLRLISARLLIQPLK